MCRNSAKKILLVLVALSNFPRIAGKVNRLLTEFLGNCKLHTEIRPEYLHVAEAGALREIF